MKKLYALLAALLVPGVASAGFGLSTTLLNFGDVPINTNSNIASVTVVNTGSEDISNIDVFIHGHEFWFEHTDCPNILLVGRQCQVLVRMTPDRPGSFRKKLIISGEDSTGSFSEMVRLEGRSSN